MNRDPIELTQMEFEQVRDNISDYLKMGFPQQHEYAEEYKKLINKAIADLQQWKEDIDTFLENAL